MSRTPIAVIALAAAGAGLPAQAQEFSRLTAAELQERVIGNTITGPGRTGSCTFFDHFAPDGSATAKCGSYTDSGTWRIAEDALCVKWSRRPTETCLVMSTDGKEYRVVNPHRGPTPFPFRILTGRQEG